MFKKMLESRGWHIFTTPTGLSALSIVEKGEIDLVLLDILLPDKSGLDVLREIKQNFPTLPVIMVTGLGYEDDLVNHAIRLGASGYVSKGVPVKEVMEVIYNTLPR